MNLASRLGVDVALARLMAAQHGVFNLDQAIAMGMSRDALRRRVAKGQLIRLNPRTYAAAGAPPTWKRDLTAATLWAGDGTAASGRAACRLWGFEGFGRAGIEISTTARTCRPPAGMTVHKVDRHLLDEIVTVDGISVTSVRRTLLNIAGVKHRRTEKALDEALRRKLTDLGQMWLYLHQEWMRGRRGVAIVRVLLQARTDDIAVTESDSEVALRRLIDRAGYPAPVHQHPIELPSGDHRFDLAYPGGRLAIEADSWGFHGDKRSFEDDRRRDAEASMLGWTVLRFTWADIHYRPGWVIDVIGHHLLGHVVESAMSDA